MASAWLLGGGIVWVAAGGALGSGVALLVIHVWTTRDEIMRQAVVVDREPVAWGRVARLAVQALPLGIVMLLVSLQTNVPRYFIRHYGGAAALGIFAAASQLTSAGGLLVGSLSAAAVPRLAGLYAAGNTDAFRAFTRKLVLFGGLLGVAGTVLSSLIGREVLVLAYRPEFGSGARVLVVLSVAAGFQFMASFLGYAFTSARIVKVQPFIFAVTLGVLIACCALLVPTRGAEGAAWALVAAVSVQVVVSEFLLRRFCTESTVGGGALAAP